MPNFNPTLPFSLEYLGEYKPTGNPSELLRTESSRDSDFLYCEEEAFNEGSVIHAYEVHDANGGSTFPDEYETVFIEETKRDEIEVTLYHVLFGNVSELFDNLRDAEKRMTELVQFLAPSEDND